MNFQRQDLAGEIRKERFFRPVPIKMRPSGQDIFFRILFVIALAILGGVLIANSGCTSPSSVQFAPLMQIDVHDNTANANGNTVTPGKF